MPHIIAEYAAPVAEKCDLGALIRGLSLRLAEFETVDLAAIKARAVPCHIYTVAGRGPESLFVHLSINVMAGRPLPLLESIKSALHILAHDQISAAMPDCAVTLEIREMVKELYQK